MKILQSQKGNTLLITVFVLVMASVIGLTLMGLSLNGTTRNDHREKYSQAIEQAEKGLQHITLEIQEKLKHSIASLEAAELAEAQDNDFDYMGANQYVSTFNKAFNDILEPYLCDTDPTTNNLINVEESNLSYTVCLDDNPYELGMNNRDHTIRDLTFISTGTANGVTKGLKSKIRLGAAYTNFPKELNYAVATDNGGNLMLNGGITINGDVRADGNIIISDSGYLPRLINSKRWIDSVYPSIAGKTSFPSKTGNPRIYVNHSEGHLFTINSDALNNGCKQNLISIGKLINIDFTNYINYKDLYGYDFNKNLENNCLYNVNNFDDINNYLFRTETMPKIELFDTTKADPIDVKSIVEQGKKRLAQKVIKSDSFYSTYTRYNKHGWPFGNGAAVLNGSYTAPSPKWFKLGIQTHLFSSFMDEQTITGKNDEASFFRVTANSFLAATSEYALNGNFHFYGANLNLTGNGKNTFNGNYYFSNSIPTLTPDSNDETLENYDIDERINTEKTSIWIEDGKHKFNGNFYLDSGIMNRALNINRGEHTFIGTYFLDGDVEINGLKGLIVAPAIIHSDAVFFVDGDVKIDNTIINGIGDNGRLIIFATGDITYNYAVNKNNGNYYNDTKQEMDAFFYANGKVELHGTLSNYEINGGIAGKNLYLTGIRGRVKKNWSIPSGFPSVSSQEQADSRLIINYDDSIVTTFYKSNNIGIEYHDLNLQPITILSRELN